MNLTRYIGVRLLLVVPMLLGISLITFILSHAVPGDPVAMNLGQRAVDDPAAVAAFRQQWGLDKSLPEQFVTYIGNLVRGDLGQSQQTHRAVTADLRDFLPATLELALSGILLSLLFGITFGIAAAVYRNRWIDHMLRLVSLIGVSMPVFWLALVGLYVLYFKLSWLPGPGRLDNDVAPPPTITGMYTVDALLTGNWTTYLSALHHLILPSLILAAYTLGLITRITRGALLEVLGQDYVRTARAKGLASRVVLLRHALRNAFIPILTVVGLAFGNLLSGAVLTETIFAWPGLGRYAFQSATNLDFPAIVGVALVVALMYILVNLAVDVMQAVVDPRQRNARAKA